MSLILEALKKSEQQRRLGEAPTLGSPVFAARRRRRLLPWLAAAILLAAVGGWWLWRQDRAAAPEPRVAAVAPDAPPTAPAATPSPAATPATPPQVVPRTVRPPQRPATPPRTARAADAPTTADAERARAAVASERGVPTPAPVVIAPGAADRPGSVAELPVSPLTRGPRQPPAAAGASGQPATTPAGSQAKAATPPAAPATRPVPAGNRAPVRSPAYPSVWELPYSMRKDLPPLDLTMHVFAADPSARFVILDGERHVEGDDLGDGLSLLEIREDGLVLAFKGQRFVYPRDGR